MTNAAIIAALEREANLHAKAHADDVAAFHRRERLRRMVVLVRDVVEWMETRGDGARLAALGVTVSVGDGAFSLTQRGRRIDVHAREDMSVMVAGKLVRPNRDCPVLDQCCYDEIMGLVFRWATAVRPRT